MGFIIGTTHIAEDKIDPKDAREVIASLPPFVSSVMVTHLTDAGKIAELARYLGVTTVQIHDYVEPDVALQVRNFLPGMKIIKAIPVVERKAALEMSRSFQEVCDALLLDSVSPGRIGGTGKVHDWELSREIIEMSDLLVFLAGGLNPVNVAEAVKIVKPFGVDVNSGVEVAGFKDPKLCQDFVSCAQGGF